MTSEFEALKATITNLMEAIELCGAGFMHYKGGDSYTEAELSHRKAEEYKNRRREAVSDLLGAVKRYERFIEDAETIKEFEDFEEFEEFKEFERIEQYLERRLLELKAERDLLQKPQQPSPS